LLLKSERSEEKKIELDLVNLTDVGGRLWSFFFYFLMVSLCLMFCGIYMHLFMFFIMFLKYILWDIFMFFIMLSDSAHNISKTFAGLLLDASNLLLAVATELPW
jgi:hypothetical protein